MNEERYKEYLHYKKHEVSRDLRGKNKKGFQHYSKVEPQLLMKYPHLTKIKQLQCLSMMLSNLSKNVKENILYYYQYKKKLTIVVSSNAFQQEIVYKKSLLKSLLKMIKREKKDCSDIEIFEDLKVIVERRIKEKVKQLVLVYLERAEGDFQNLANNPLVQQKLEEIRSVIKSVKQ